MRRLPVYFSSLYTFLPLLFVGPCLLCHSLHNAPLLSFHRFQFSQIAFTVKSHDIPAALNHPTNLLNPVSQQSCSTPPPSFWLLPALLPLSPPPLPARPRLPLPPPSLAVAPPLMRMLRSTFLYTENVSNTSNSIITNCLASTSIRVSACDSQDWNCLCDNQRAVLTCYDNCPSCESKSTIPALLRASEI